MSITSVAFAVGIPLSSAVAEQGQDPRQAYNQALNDCVQLDNPTPAAGQLCEQKAKEWFEQAQKSGGERTAAACKNRSASSN